MADWVLAIGYLITAGASIWSSDKQQHEMTKARREQRAALAKAEAEAKAEKERIENLEKERAERLKRKGSGLPPSLITGMSGVEGDPSLLKPTLG